MQIVQTSSSSGVNAKGAGTARVVDDASAAINGSASARSEAPAAKRSTASLQRGLSNWDHQLQGRFPTHNKHSTIWNAAAASCKR